MDGEPSILGIDFFATAKSNNHLVIHREKQVKIF